MKGYRDYNERYNAGTRDYDSITRSYRDYDSITRSYRRKREGVRTIGLD